MHPSLRMRRTLFVLLLAAAAGADRHGWDRPHQVRTRRYAVTTNTFPELARDLGTSLDEAFSLFEDRFGPLTGAAAAPMEIALYRTHGEYLARGDGVTGAVGHFDGARDRCAFAWDGHTGRAGWPVAVHEACHQYFRRRFPRLAPATWYSEGIACWFEGLQDRSSARHVSRLRLRAAKAALAAGDAHLPLLLKTRARVERGELRLLNFAPARYYALAWSLVHFLATDEEMAPRFRRFELRLFASRPRDGDREALARRLLEEECGDLGELEDRWRAHLRALAAPPPVATPPVYAYELTAASAFLRYDALRRLRDRAWDVSLRATIVGAAHDPDVIVRGEALARLAEDMGADAVPAMVAALEFGDPVLDEIALTALAHPAARAAVPRLLAEHGRRDLACEALAAIGDPRAFAALRDAVVDPSLPPRTRARAARALARDPAAERVLLSAAHDRAPAVKSAARRALIARGAELPSPDRPARPANVAARRVRVLLDALADPGADATDRIRACRLVADAKLADAVPLLRRLCRAREPDRVRLAAVRALVAITGETRGFRDAQPPREREAAFRAWAQ